MIPEDLYRITVVGDAQIAPDGHTIAFVQTCMDDAADDYRSQIWETAFQGGKPRRLTSGSRRDTHPRWSPDGRWLAFLSDRDSDKKQIWLLPANGGEASKLTEQVNGIESFSWSPGSDRICFAARVSQEEGASQKLDASKSGDRPRAPTRFITTLKYKLNGEGFTYDRRPHIFVMDVTNDKTDECRQLTGGDFDDEGPAWSPDGQLIAFTSARHPTRETDSVTDIFVVPAAGGDVRRITSGLGPSHAATFSPDGSLVAYLGHTDRHAGGAHNTRLWLVPVDGGSARELAEGLDRTVASETPPAWSSDGTRLYFSVVDQGTVCVRSASVAGGSSSPFASGQQVISSWSLDAGRTRLAFTASTPADPGDVFAQELQDGPRPKSAPQGAQRLTNVNAQWLAEVALSEPESFSYVSDGGVRVQGWIMKPALIESGTTHPLLLNVHGGPHMYYGWGFFDEFQVQASAGYAVLYTNPRGSQGYGESFASACSRDWGGKDYEDVMRGLDHALSAFEYIDAGRLGVLGGSYGGFMTSWIVGHTNRFRAAVSERAVNALPSLFGTSDIGYWFEQFEVGGTPIEALGRYVERSPLAYAANVTTPLLIMHSENDLRCPIEQAEQFYVALKLLARAEVAFVRFPDESHELTRSGRPSRRVERFAIILDWFDRFLDATGGRTHRSTALKEALGSVG